MNKVFAFLFFLVTNSAIAQISINDAFPNGVGLADLGLSVKWASCNVGASSPEDIGRYYSYPEHFGNSKVGELRLPTYEEVDELLTDCTWTISKINGVKGYKITGPSGNSIFLPLGGQNVKDNYGTKIKYKGKYGWYWVAPPHDEGSIVDHYFLEIQKVQRIFVDYSPFDVKAVPLRLVTDK